VRLARAAALAAAALVVVALVAPAAGAATTTTSGTSGVAAGHITLVQQPPWTTFGRDVPLHVRIDGDPTQLTVQVALHSALSSRTSFQDTVTDADHLGTVRRGGRNSVKVTDLARQGSTYTITGLVSAPRSSPGVYPLEVDLSDARTGARVDGFVTYVVAVPSAPSTAVGEQLRVSWVWPVVANPAYEPNGSPDPAVVAELQSTGRLGKLATLLASASDLPITVAPGPETLESWATLGAGNKGLASSFATFRGGAKVILPGPYVPIDVPALVGAGLGSEVGVELAAGAQALTSTLGMRADARTVAVDSINAPALDQLSAAGVDRLVLTPSQLEPVTAKLTPARPFTLQSTQGRTVTAAATDPDLARLLEGADVAPALRAQRFLAGLAIVALEAPNSRRGVVVEMPARWNPDPATSSAVTSVLRGLRGNPLVDVVGVPKLLDDVPLETAAGSSRRPAPPRQLRPLRPATPVVNAHDLRTAAQRLDAFRDLLAPDDPRARRGDRAVLVAMSSVWTGGAGRKRAAAELGVVDSSITQFTNLIRGPSHDTVTITARRARIPISLQNTTAQPVKVRVRLQSEKLFFPNGAERVLTLPPHNTTARFAVETRASGTFPMLVTVSSADGRIVFQEARFTIRSTVVSGVGLFLTIGAGLFLAGWWANHFRRRRQGLRAARTSGSTPVQRPDEAWEPTAPTSGSVR
jgi:hypothetical protein